MSIRDIQIENALEKIVRAALQRGEHPRLRETVNKADLSRLGMPHEYQDVAKRGNLLSSSIMNESLTQYEEDFSVLDQAIVESEKWTSLAEDGFIGRYTAAQSLYEKLALQVTALALAVKSGTNSVYSITESFSSLENVDLDHTDAFVDTSIGQVTLPRAADTLTTLEYGSGISLISCDKSMNGTIWVGTPPNGLSPIFEHPVYQGKLWYRYIFKLQTQRVELDDESNVASIEFSVPTFRESQNTISVKVSDDLKNWRPLSNLERGSRLCFIPSDPFEYIEIIIAKQAYDQLHVTDKGTVSYLYLPYIENLLIRAFTYRHSATLQTKSYSIANVAQNLGLSALQFTPYHITPGQSTISYHIQKDNGPWTQILPGETISLARDSVKEEILYPISPMGAAGNSVKIWGGLPQMSEAELFEGYNQAEQQWLPESTGNYTLDSWATAAVSYKIPTKYIDLKERPLLSAGNTHKLYFKIISDTARDFSVQSLCFKRETDQSNVTTTLRIFINNMEITPASYADGSYSFEGSLLQGENYFNLLISVAEDAILNLEDDLLNNNHIYINKYAYTSLNNLFNPFLKLNYLLINQCLFNVSDSGNLLINKYPYYNPRYLLRYRSTEGTVPSEVTIKAVLNGTDTDSPILDDFTLLISEPVGW